MKKKIRSKYKNNISSVIITHVNEFIVKVVVNYAIIKKTKQKITNLPHQDQRMRKLRPKTRW